MTKSPPDKVLAALIALGAIAAGQDEFIQLWGNHILGLLNDADIRRALKYILDHGDGGRDVLRKVVKNLRRFAGQRPPHLQIALDELARTADALPVVSAAEIWKKRGARVA